MESEIDRIILHTNYRVDLRPRIKVDILANLRNFPSLRCELATYKENNQDFKICSLNGSILVNYNNNNYSIPINCLIPSRYPIIPPIIYVRNPIGTYLSPSIYLESDGQVKHPTLSHWDFKKASLGNLLHDIAAGFSHYFPIVSTPSKQVYTDHSVKSPAIKSSNSFRIDPNNETHSVYFRYEQEEKQIESRIKQMLDDLNNINIENPANLIKDLKQAYYDCFIANRKKEKAVLILSKLGNQ